MANTPQITITDFTGQAENAHIGFGANVGVDLFTTKNVARLSRKMVKKSGSLVTDLPLYDCIDIDRYIYVQDASGKIYTSVDNGVNWSVLAGNSGNDGYGIISFQDTNSVLASRKKYLLSFTPGDIDLYDFSTSTWTNGWWTSVLGANQAALQNQVNTNHLPFAYGLAIYFCNGNYIGLFQQFASSTGVVFDKTNSTTFLASPAKFQLDNGYLATTIGLLPPSSFGIGFINTYNPSQSGVVIWDGVQIASGINLALLPGASNPVMQLITKNGVLYAVTDKEHGIYTVNGSSAQLVDRLTLRMTNRKVTGEQYTTRITSTIHPQAIDFLGPELLTGGDNNPQPATEITGTGMFPYGVWSVNIENKVVGTRFPLSHGDINAQYSTNYEIGFIRVLSNNAVIVGWGKAGVFGIDVLSDSDYITDSNTVFVESELFEVGTRITGKTFNNIVYNLVTPLLTGQQIEFYYRTNQSSPYTLFRTDTNTTIGGETGNIISPLPFQQVKYIQFAVRLKADAGTANQTPQLDSIYLN